MSRDPSAGAGAGVNVLVHKGVTVPSKGGQVGGGHVRCVHLVCCEILFAAGSRPPLVSGNVSIPS